MGDISDLEQKIIRQVEYYFGDYNLPKDKFLQTEIKKDDGWVTMETMLNSQRLKSLSDDTAVICAALKKSSSKLMEVAEDGAKIRRSPDKPLPELTEARRQEIMSRSVYLKGFPQTGVTLDNLLEFFKQFGTVENIQMRNYHDKVEDNWKFKGSVFVTFPTKEEAEAFLKLETVKHEDKELIRKWQADYIEEKKLERKDGKKTKERRKEELKKAADGDKKEGETEKDGEDEANGEEEEGNKEENGKEDEKKVEHILGAVILLKGLKSTTKWPTIRDKIVELGGDVAFVDFKQGDPEAYVRLKVADSAKEVLEKMGEDKKVEVDGEQVEARVLEGEEEKKYLDDQAEARKNIRYQLKRKGSARGRGRGRGGWRGAKRGRR